jgi:hypothetical protein
VESATVHGHGKRGHESPTYVAWKNMLARCRPKHKQAANYAERGIVVCERWKEFANFLADMGEKPIGMTIDRIDNDGNYEPGNCRWASMLHQQRNRSNNRLIDYQGRKITLSEAEEITGLGERTIWCRLNRGWTDAEALRPVSKVVRA